MAKETPEKEKATAVKQDAPVKEKKVAPAVSAEEAETPAPKKEVTAEDLLKDEIGAVKIRKAKGSKNVSVGIAKVLATFNNTKICITDTRGNVISWSSSGKMNF